jgi:hypothetical protein
VKAELATITEIGRSLAGYGTSAGHVSYVDSRKTRSWGMYATIGFFINLSGFDDYVDRFERPW